MTEMSWQFEALDSFFFRDAAPFNQGEGGQGGQSSIFPPAMNTLQGAIRYQLAWGQGWKPGHDRDWPVELGDNDDLGQLRLRGPYLCWKGEIIYPAPRYLLYRGQEEIEFNRLVPGSKVKTDLGQVSLPVMPDNWTGSKVLEDGWLTGSALSQVLAGGIPSRMGKSEQDDQLRQVWFSHELWSDESKVGIGRNHQTRTAANGQLYAIKMVRPQRELSLMVGVDGVPADWSDSYPKTVRLGGEGRQAALKVTEGPIPLPAVPEFHPVQGKIRFTTTLITPACFGGDFDTAVKGELGNVPGKCITACIGKAFQIGGWDLKLRAPRPLRLFLPVGSSWFFEADPTLIDDVKALQGTFIGEKDSYGYGQILIGRWGEEQ